MRSAVRWSVPAAVAAGVVAVSGLSGMSAGASVKLPPRTAAQLLADVATSHVAGVSGQVTVVANLGLPQLPSGDSAGGLSLSGWSSLLAGTNTLRVWASRNGGLRVALPSQFAESDIVAGRDGLWLYDSRSNAATHVVGPARAAAGAAGAEPDGRMPAGMPALTPQQAATEALAAAGRTTAISVSHDAEVAGRAAYQLTLHPDSAASLIGRITIAIDAKTGMPLRVQVYARGGKSPALQVGWSAVHFGSVGRSMFAFTPPPGARVHTVRLPATLPHSAGHRPPADAGQGQARVVGHGWGAVAVIEHVRVSGQLAAMLHQMGTPVSGQFGSGVLVRTALVDALVTSDGRLLVGAVTPATLGAAAISGR